jgi:hypothetical protein
MLLQSIFARAAIASKIANPWLHSGLRCFRGMPPVADPAAARNRVFLLPFIFFSFARPGGAARPASTGRYAVRCRHRQGEMEINRKPLEMKAHLKLMH